MEEIRNTSENLEKNNSSSKQKRKAPYKRNYNKKNSTNGENTKKANLKRGEEKTETIFKKSPL